MALCGSFRFLPATPEVARRKRPPRRTVDHLPATYAFRAATDDSPSRRSGSVSDRSAGGSSSRRSDSPPSRDGGDGGPPRRGRPRPDGGDGRCRREALFDAATESESASGDPLVGSLVGGPEAGEAARRAEAEAAGDPPSGLDGRRRLWRAALRSHRERQGRSEPGRRQSTQRQQQEQRQELPSRSLRERQSKLEELDSVIIRHCNDSKESLNTNNIRKRGLKNIHQYLPSLSESVGNSHERLALAEASSRDRLRAEKKKRKCNNRNSKYCPQCSCRLTYLYSSKRTKRLTEMDSGRDSPPTKAKAALPPYCINCRAYLIYESWEEEKRRRLLGNFERRVGGLASPPSSPTAEEDGDGDPLRDFGNARLVVVDSASSDGMDAEVSDAPSRASDDGRRVETPRISDSASEASSLRAESDRGEGEEDARVGVDGLNAVSSLTDFDGATFAPERCGRDGEAPAPARACRRKGRRMFDSRSFEERGEAGSERRGGREPSEEKSELEVDTCPDRSSVPDDGSDEDPFSDLKSSLKTPVSETMREAGADVGSDFRSDAAGRNEQNERNDVRPPTAPCDPDRRPPYQVIDQTITFKSPTFAELVDRTPTIPAAFKSPANTAKNCIREAQLAVASTFSEEFAMFQNYSVKKEAAAHQIAKCLHRGYELTSVKCDRCEMPMMTRGGEEGEMICVACPAIMKRVRRLVREKRGDGEAVGSGRADGEEKKNCLKTPKVSNVQVGSYDEDEDAEEQMDNEDRRRFRVDFRDSSELAQDAGSLKKSSLKTPKISNVRYGTSGSVEEMGSYDEDVEERMDREDRDRFRVGFRDSSELVRDEASRQDADERSIDPPEVDLPRTTSFRRTRVNDASLDQMEAGSIHGRSPQKYYNQRQMNQSLPIGTGDYWVAHSAMQVGRNQQPRFQSDGYNPNEHIHIQPQTHYPGYAQWQDPLANEIQQQHIRQQSSYHDDYASQDFHPNGHYRQPFRSENTQYHHYGYGAGESNQRGIHQQSSYHDTNNGAGESNQRGIHQQSSYHDTNHGAGESNQRDIHQQSSYHDTNHGAGESNQRGIHQQSSHHDTNHGAGESNQRDIHQQSSYLDVNVASFESGQESFHNNCINGESVESVTKCPRGLPQSDQIWQNNPSHAGIAHISRDNPTRSVNSNSHTLNGKARPERDRAWEPLVREGPYSGPSDAAADERFHQICPVPSRDRSESKGASDHIENIQKTNQDDVANFGSVQKSFFGPTDLPMANSVEDSGNGGAHLSQPVETHVKGIPKNSKIRALWDECIPVSYELNSSAKQQTGAGASIQTWSAPQQRTMQSWAEQRGHSIEKLVTPIRLFEEEEKSSSPRIHSLPRNHLYATNGINNKPFSPTGLKASPLSAEKKRFDERIHHLSSPSERSSKHFEPSINERQHNELDVNRVHRDPVSLSVDEPFHTLRQHEELDVKRAHRDPVPFSVDEPLHLSRQHEELDVKRAYQDPVQLSVDEPLHPSNHSRPAGFSTEIHGTPSTSVRNPQRSKPLSFLHDANDNQDNQNKQTNLRSKKLSPVQIRKPLEPLERDDDLYHHSLDPCNRENQVIESCPASGLRTDMLKNLRDPDTPRRSAADPPGFKSVARDDDDAAQHFVRIPRISHRSNNARSQQNMHQGEEKSRTGREPATPKLWRADPPERVLESTRSDPESRAANCIHGRNGSVLKMKGCDGLSQNRAALPQLQADQQASASNRVTLQNKFHHVRTPKSRGNSSTSFKRPVPEMQEAFRLNIPSWVDDEIDKTPIEPVKSFGESSMDQLMRKIEEIENDFSTIVASLPGSDGFSLRLTKTDDNSTLASKPSFELDQEIERVRHQLASNSFDSQESQEQLMSGILQQMRLVQDQIEQLDSSELEDGSEGGYESQGEMAELIQRLANAAESLRSLQIE